MFLGLGQLISAQSDEPWGYIFQCVSGILLHSSVLRSSPFFSELPHMFVFGQTWRWSAGKKECDRLALFHSSHYCAPLEKDGFPVRRFSKWLDLKSVRYMNYKTSLTTRSEYQGTGIVKSFSNQMKTNYLF